MPKEIEYTTELGEMICEAISDSQLVLKNLCESIDWMPKPTTIKKWIRLDKRENESDTEGFATLYARAKEEQADSLVEEMLTIADDASKDTLAGEFGEHGNAVAVARARLQVDTRKFIASKLKPKKYGDKLDVTTLGEKISTTVIKWGDKEIEI